MNENDTNNENQNQNQNQNKNQNDFTENVRDTVQKVLNTEDTSSEYSAEDKEKNKWMAALSYILAPIPYFVKTESKFVRYHSIQGMNYFVTAVAYAIISAILRNIIKVKRTQTYLGITLGYIKVTPWWVVWPLTIISICIGIIGIIGIVNALSGKAKELPIFNKVKLFK